MARILCKQGHSGKATVSQGCYNSTGQAQEVAFPKVLQGVEKDVQG